VDANRPVETALQSPLAEPYYRAYHRAIRAFVDEIRACWGAGLLLDIHGQSAEPDALFRGTLDGKTVTALLERHGRVALDGAASILGVLRGRGYKAFPLAPAREEPRYRGGYTVRTYGSHTTRGIDAIQLEVGSRFRHEHARRGAFARDLAAAIRTFLEAYVDWRAPCRRGRYRGLGAGVE
jgi:N-formylglutamate amidohydrolase